jgi:hypothetical protein
MQLLRGVIHGGGRVSPEGTGYEVSVKDRYFIEDISFLARSLGCRTGKIEEERLMKQNKEETGSTGFRVRLSDRNVIREALQKRGLCADLSGEWRDERCDRFHIEKVEHAHYYSITVDGNGRFLLGDFVVAHNSSYCRTAGLNILMAQIGSFLPASSATITVVDSILSRVGAGDSTTRSQSTFMVEMLEAASILKLATENSFVIIDELGRGTSIDDGFGLAYAIAEHLAKNVKCWTFFASHYFEITALSEKQKG